MLYLMLLATLYALTSPAHAALIPRGSNLVYDTDLGITWLADANLAATQNFGIPGVDADGAMFGGAALAWIDRMNAFQDKGFLGYDSWRLTRDDCVETAGYNCTESEFGHLFYIELGGSAFSPVTATGDPDLALFTNIVADSSFYWTGTFDGAKMRVFRFGDGGHSKTFPTLAKFHVWPVLDGDPAAVPEPTPVFLIPIALALIVLRRPCSAPLARQQRAKLP